MSIHFLCPLGHPLVVPDERAGKKGRCPICQQRVYVPELQSASPGNSAPVPGDEVEIDARPAPATSRAEPMSELDRILAEELGLGTPPVPKAPVPPPTPQAAVTSSPPSRQPPESPVSPGNFSSPYAPAVSDTALHREVPPPGAARPAKDLSSPGRPVREAVPPQRAVPPVAAAAPPTPEVDSLLFTLATPSLSQAPSTSVAPTLPTWPATLPVTSDVGTPPVAQHPSAPIYRAPPAQVAPPTQPHTIPIAPQPPSLAQAPTAVPLAAAAATQVPSIHAAASETKTTDVRVFPADEPLPWTVAPNETETHYELFVNEGWPQTTYLMVAAIVVAAGLGIIPLLSRWTGGVMPQWVTIVVGLTVIELSIALWLASLPDWSMLNLAGIATGLIAACYASGVAMVVTNASANALPLDLFDVRNYAGGWCTGNALCWGMISYALVRAARQWKRNLRRLLRQV